MRKLTAVLVMVLSFQSVHGHSYAAAGGFAQAIQNGLLANFDCLSIYAAEDGDLKLSNSSGDELKDAVLVALKSKIPGLKVNESCGNAILLAVSGLQVKTAGGAGTGYVMHVELEIQRPASLLNGEAVPGSVFHASSLNYGPMDKLRGTIFEEIEDLVRTFAAAYYKAGNK